jgi:hypothetical protein
VSVVPLHEVPPGGVSILGFLQFQGQVIRHSFHGRGSQLQIDNFVKPLVRLRLFQIFQDPLITTATEGKFGPALLFWPIFVSSWEVLHLLGFEFEVRFSSDFHAGPGIARAALSWSHGSSCVSCSLVCNCKSTTAIKYCELGNVNNRLNVIIKIMILLITSALLSFLLLYWRSATQIRQSLVYNYP